MHADPTLNFIPYVESYNSLSAFHLKSTLYFFHDLISGIS